MRLDRAAVVSVGADGEVHYSVLNVLRLMRIHQSI